MQAADHPVHPAIPETAYLKAFYRARCRRLKAQPYKMPPMLTYPNIDPVALNLGTWHLFGHVFQPAIHWYGITYLVGFLGGYLVHVPSGTRPGSGWSTEQLQDLLFYVALGVVLGGRIGYMLFYAYDNRVTGSNGRTRSNLPGMGWWHDFPRRPPGRAGGHLAVRTQDQKRYFDVADFSRRWCPSASGPGASVISSMASCGARSLDLPWAMRIPCIDTRFSGGEYCQHTMNGYSPPHQPSQLYEFLLEGVVMFAVLWLYSAKPRPRMAVSGLFALLYGIFRFLVEFVRMPDPQLGYLAFGWLTMGQILSLPLIAAGHRV